MHCFHFKPHAWPFDIFYVPIYFPWEYHECMDKWYALKSTHLKALFCWSYVLNYCSLPDCSLPCSWMFSQASPLPLHVKPYTALTYITGQHSNNPALPGPAALALPAHSHSLRGTNHSVSPYISWTSARASFSEGIAEEAKSYYCGRPRWEHYLFLYTLVPI